jgi:L-methionine (R)-S-oxide reductase
VAEELIDLRGLPREQAYDELRGYVAAALAGVSDRTAAMATISSLVHHSLGFLWTGFYRVVAPRKLLVGPYQGSLGCLEIDFGRGVCGTAAETRQAVIVEDVLLHENHITCDPRARSEIVVPVFDGSGELIAVFDVDSDQPGSFSEADKTGLEQILTWFTAPERSTRDYAA